MGVGFQAYSGEMMQSQLSEFDRYLSLKRTGGVERRGKEWRDEDRKADKLPWKRKAWHDQAWRVKNMKGE